MPAFRPASPLVAAFCLAGLAGVALAAEGFNLILKTSVGSVDRYRQETIIRLEDESLELVTENTVRVTAIDPANGDLTLQVSSVAAAIRVAGEEIPLDGLEEEDDEATIVVRRNGELRSMTPGTPPADEIDEETNRESVRLSTVTQLVVPDRLVHVGDVWTHETPAREREGIRAGTMRFEAVAEESLHGLRVFKVRITSRETEGEHPIQVEGHHWVSVTDGKQMKYDFQVRNMPLLGEAVDAEIRGEWIP